MKRSFTRRARLAYFVAWIPMTALLGLLLHVQGIERLQSLGLSLILAIPYGLVCGSSYYMCRAMPLRKSRFSQVFTSLLGVILLASGTWVGLFYGVAFLSGWIPMGSLSGFLWLVFGVGAAYFALSLAFHYLVLAVEEIRRVEKQADEAKVLKRDAELKAIRAQLNPHFLFNSLNSIAALTSTDSDRAREMVLQLSAFFRATLDLGKRNRVTLGEEMALVDHYLEIEMVRFSDKLQVVRSIDKRCLGVMVPPLLLQPLVENAVKHGVANRTDASTIVISASFISELPSDKWVTLSIGNDLDSVAGSGVGVGHGLRSTEERLRLFYGGDAHMMVKQTNGKYEVTFKLPVGN